MWGGVGSLTENDINGTVTYTVTFDSNGGTEIDPVKVPSGGTIEKPNDPLKEGYVFSGWFKDNETFNDPFIFGTDGDKISHDITLYAQWVEPDTLIAEYAAGEIVIGYAAGDNAKHVTQNLTLPTKIESSDITWESNSGAVSTNGTVTRQNTDTDVILTATANYNGKKSATKTFNVKVIKKRTRDNSKIEALTIAKASSGDVTITRNESGDVTDIEGQYVSFDINNADDALDAVTVLRNELGIKNPEKELKTFRVTSDAYSSEYKLQQFYNGVRVLGRRIMVSTGSNNKGDFLHSSFLSSDIIENAHMQINITSSDAENIAKNYYSGEFEVNSADTELIVYSLEGYEKNPVYVYIVNISGTKDDGVYVDENVFVHADSGKGNVIGSFSNVSHAVDDIHNRLFIGKNEQGSWQTFPVAIVNDNEVEMTDTSETPRVEIHKIDFQLFNIHTTSPLKRKTNGEQWDDPQAVSAYVNMREIVKWWKDKFGRNSLDDNGMTVKVVVHQTIFNDENSKRDNACWANKSQKIYISDAEKHPYSSASAVDVLTHESTHAVLQYETGCDNWSINPTLGAITEGYADVFACLKDQNWKLGEKLFTDESKFLRNIKDNIAGVTTEKYENGVHYIAHVAYLMHESSGVEDGLTWDELGELWYKSIRKELIETSTFEDVRRCVRWAAAEMLDAGKLSPQKIPAIEDAFYQAEPYATEAILNGTVTDSNTGEPLEKVYVYALRSGFQKKETYTDKNGKFVLRLYKGNYSLFVSANPETDYIDAPRTEIDLSQDINNINIKLVKDDAPDTQDNSEPPNTPTPANPDNSEEPNTPAPVVTGDVPIDEAHFPDAKFRSYVKSNFDTDSNGILSDEEIKKVTSIDVIYSNISSLQGIEYFTALTYLDCGLNQLTELDVSKNTALTELYCYKNQLTELDVSKNTALIELYCCNNQLTELDVSKNTALTWLYCKYNQLKKLDLSNCPKLNRSNLRCDDTVIVTWPPTASASSVSSTASAGTSTDDSPGCNVSMFGIAILFSGVIFARKH